MYDIRIHVLFFFLYFRKRSRQRPPRHRPPPPATLPPFCFRPPMPLPLVLTSPGQSDSGSVRRGLCSPGPFILGAVLTSPIGDHDPLFTIREFTSAKASPLTFLLTDQILSLSNNNNNKKLSSKVFGYYLGLRPFCEGSYLPQRQIFVSSAKTPTQNDTSNINRPKHFNTPQRFNTTNLDRVFPFSVVPRSGRPC
jgi:hypothetical protein